MPIELSYLVCAVLLYGVMILVQAIFSNIEHAPVDLAGSRDGIVDHSPMVGRAKRANQNMVEALLLFVPLVLVAGYLDRFNEMTQLGAGLFLAGRIAYAPLYWFGVPWLRTLAWFVAVVGTTLILLQVLPFSGAA